MKQSIYKVEIKSPIGYTMPVAVRADDVEMAKKIVQNVYPTFFVKTAELVRY
jgi:hypothetical protein